MKHAPDADNGTMMYTPGKTNRSSCALLGLGFGITIAIVSCLSIFVHYRSRQPVTRLQVTSISGLRLPVGSTILDSYYEQSLSPYLLVHVQMSRSDTSDFLKSLSGRITPEPIFVLMDDGRVTRYKRWNLIGAKNVVAYGGGPSVLDRLKVWHILVDDDKPGISELYILWYN